MTMRLKLIFKFIIFSILVIFSFVRQPSKNIEKFKNEKLREFEIVAIEDGNGPESFAFDSFGEGPYTGLSDGRIVKWQPNQRRWIDFAITSPTRNGCKKTLDEDQMEQNCGRPLGLCFDKSNGNLYIADAYKGLLTVGPEGGLANAVATHFDGTPFAFTNGLDIDQSTGDVYFTDSSSLYPRRTYISIILSGDKSGRLMKYDPKNKKVTQILNNLSFPNGLALSEDGNSILISETNNGRILKYWIKTSKIGNLEVFAELQGFPDNIKRSPRGGYWVGMHSKREKILEWILSYPFLGNTLLRLPFDMMKIHSFLAKYRGSGMAVRLSQNGDVLEILENKDGEGLKRSISEVVEKDRKLWVGSINLPYVVKYET